MIKKGMRTCCVCHREYMYCPVCNPEDRQKPTWYYAYCGENCKDIYTVTSDYENGKISADDAKQQLDKLDLSKIADFGESYKNAIDKINKNATNVEPRNKTLETPLTNDENIDDVKNIKYCKKPRIKQVKDDGKIE